MSVIEHDCTLKKMISLRKRFFALICSSIMQRKELKIRMETSYHKIYPKECKQNGKETNNHHIGCFATSPANCEPIVNEDGVNNPSYQRPRFFWVPAPVGTPCHTCP